MFRILGVGMTAVIGLAALIVAFFTMAPTLINHNEDLRTDPAQDVALACATGAGETLCDITLAAVHEYHDTSFMTVTETLQGDGDVTANSYLDTRSQQIVTVSGLTQNTAYQFTVDYAAQAANISDEMGDVLKQTPVLIALAFLVALVGGLGAFAVFRDRSPNR